FHQPAKGVFGVLVFALGETGGPHLKEGVGGLGGLLLGWSSASQGEKYQSAGEQRALERSRHGFDRAIRAPDPTIETLSIQVRTAGAACWRTFPQSSLMIRSPR